MTKKRRKTNMQKKHIPSPKMTSPEAYLQVFMLVVKNRVAPIEVKPYGTVSYFPEADKYVIQIQINDPHGVEMFATIGLPGDGVRDLADETLDIVVKGIYTTIENADEIAAGEQARIDNKRVLTIISSGHEELDD